jgi:hypothetical protein
MLIAARLAAAGLVLTPAIAARPGKKRRSSGCAQLRPVSGFTPAAADPKLAAALSAARGSSLGDFKFTPAAAKGPSVAGSGRDPRPRHQFAKADGAAGESPRVRLGIADQRAHAGSYNLGVAVGWRRFAVCRRRRQDQGSQSGARRIAKALRWASATRSRSSPAGCRRRRAWRRARR